MGLEAGSSDGLKRSKRQGSGTRSDSVKSKTTSALSQKSRSTAAHYRHVVLRGVRINIGLKPAPEDTRAQVNAIIQRKLTSERTEKLTKIAQHLNSSFVEILSKAAGKDDCIVPLYIALNSMDDSESFAFLKKAGILFLLNPFIYIYAHFVFRLAPKLETSYPATQFEFQFHSSPARG